MLKPDYSRFHQGQSWVLEANVEPDTEPTFAIAYGNLREYVLEIHDPKNDAWRPVAAGVNRVDPVHVMVLPEGIVPDKVRLYFRTVDKGSGCSGLELY